MGSQTTLSNVSTTTIQQARVTATVDAPTAMRRTCVIIERMQWGDHTQSCYIIKLKSSYSKAVFTVP